MRLLERGSSLRTPFDGLGFSRYRLRPGVWCFSRNPLGFKQTTKRAYWVRIVLQSYLATERTCPPDLVSPIHTLLYCEPRLSTKLHFEILELCKRKKRNQSEVTAAEPSAFTAPLLYLQASMSWEQFGGSLQ